MIGFNDDIEKMLDFNKLSKEEFLQSYSYLTEEEYDATMVETIRRLMKKTPNGVIHDADTILAGIVYNADVEITGLAMELLSIWEKSADKSAIEDFFYALTDVTFDDFLMRCKNILQGDNKTLYVVSGLEEPRGKDELPCDLKIERASMLPPGWNWRMYDDGSGSLRNPDGKSYFSYDISTQEYKVEYGRQWDFMPNYPSKTPFSEFQKFAEKYIITDVLEPEDLADFYIIENDPDKDYGVSFVYPDEYAGETRHVMMYRDRLTPSFILPETEDWHSIMDPYEEETENYLASGVGISLDAINTHMNFWCQQDLTKEQAAEIPIYPISELRKKLLDGFSEDRIIFTL